jgi:hypothetical protein
MRFVELSSGVLAPISNEETTVMERVRGHSKPLPRSLLNEREQELATRLVHRGILTRLAFENKICFASTDIDDFMEF